MLKKLFILFVVFLVLCAKADNFVCDTGLNLAAQFKPISYECRENYFLPANTTGCESCPDDYTCSGGTFDFNENDFQGVIKSETYITHDLTNMCSTNALHELHAVFTPNTINITWDDGTNTTQNTCTYGDEITLPPTPTRPGYVFNGWRVKEQPVPAVP